MIEEVSAHKTLFNTQNRKGLPIGNLTSQFFANVYLDVLDQFVKHQLKSGYYIRYCDDFVLLDKEKERLLEWREQIRKFLENRLLLALNDGREAIGRITNGLDFLGYIVRPNYILAKRRVVNHLKENLSAYQDRLISKEGHYTVYRYETEELRDLMATWASYMAHLKEASTCRLRKTILNRFDWLGSFFQLKGEKLKMLPEAPARLRSLKWQYRFFLGRRRGSILFFQAGRFFELYDRQAEIAMEALGLQSMKDTRGFRIRCGFPMRYKERYLKKLIQLGFTIYIITEEEGWFPYLKKRRITEEWIPMASVPLNGRRRLGK